MELKFKFDMTDLDDEYEAKRMFKSLDMALILWEIRNNLYKKCNNASQMNPEKDMLNIVFEHINNLFEEHSVDIDDLVQ